MQACRRQILHRRYSRIYRQKLSSHIGIAEKYMSQVNSCAIKYDEHQYKIVKLMDKVQNILHNSPSDSSSIGELPRGVYIWGEVGTGKTFMMDMFFQTAKEPKKRRVHFHKFMLDVHQLIHKYKQDLLRDYGRDRNINLHPDRDPVVHAANMINAEARLLCFDEFQVTDIADALIMSKLFNELWNRGTVLLATSNRPPSDLYLGGINREYFMPFIEEVGRRCIVRNLQSQVDYRELLSTRAPDAYYTPLSPEATSKLRGEFLRHQTEDDVSNDKSAGEQVSVPVMMGRELRVLARGRACWVTFSDMCEGNKGAADYSALAKHMDVIYMDGIPQLSVLKHDKARRFITFVDEIYDAGKTLRWTSETDPHEIFRFLTPDDIDESTGGGAGRRMLGTDHSWANKDIVHGETMSQTTPFVYEKASFDSISVSRHFKVENGGVSESVDDDDTAGDGSSSAELKMLEGELASIQELSFAFRRAASRLTEMSSTTYSAIVSNRSV